MRSANVNALPSVKRVAIVDKSSVWVPSVYVFGRSVSDVHRGE